jgi:hypothetical protein
MRKALLILLLFVLPLGAQTLEDYSGYSAAQLSQMVDFKTMPNTGYWNTHAYLYLQLLIDRVLAIADSNGVAISLADSTVEYSNFVQPLKDSLAASASHLKITSTNPHGLNNNSVTYAKLDTGAAGFVDVRKFGAVGDSATNDYAAIWAAIQKAKAWGVNGGKVFLPSGTYRIESTIALVGAGYKNLIIEGEGVNKTILVYSPATGNAIEIGDGTSPNTTEYIHIRNMTIKGTKSTTVIDTTNNGIVASWGANCKFTNVLVRSFRGSGFKNLQDSWTNTFVNCDFSYNNQYGVYGNKAPNLWQFNNCNFIGNKVGAFFKDAYAVSFIQCDWTTSDSTGLIVKTCNGMSFYNCWWEANNVGAYANVQHITAGDSAASTGFNNMSIIGSRFVTVASMNFAIAFTLPFNLYINSNILAGSVAPIKIKKYNTYAYQQAFGHILNVLGAGDTRPLMYMRGIPYYGNEFKENAGGLTLGKSDSIKWITWTGDASYSTIGLHGRDNTIRVLGNSTSTIDFNVNLGLDLKNTSNTNNNYMILGSRTSGGTLASGIQFKVTNQSSGYGKINFGTRSSSGFNTYNMILTENKVGINTNTVVNTLDVEGAAVIGSSYSGTSTAPSNGLLVEGNVGIGTTVPVSKLEVDGGGISFDNLTADPSSGVGWFQRCINKADADTLIYRYSDGTLKRLITP